MKRYITAFSLPRKLCITRIESFSDRILEHVTKLILFSDKRKNDVHGWIRSIANSLSQIAEVQPKGGKLSYDDYLEHCFSCFGEDLVDAKFLLASYKEDFCYKSDYPEFIIDGTLINKTRYIYDLFSDWAASSLEEEKLKTTEDFLNGLEIFFSECL